MRLVQIKRIQNVATYLVEMRGRWDGFTGTVHGYLPVRSASTDNEPAQLLPRGRGHHIPVIIAAIES
jgi:alkanesulfonate monooxygenase SsuD/methylene tetrahydromethanopterin reductase-like flavin-dependent oxidoreductase (luciferase family)